MEKVTSDGVITVEESKTAETYSEVVEGMQFDRGYISPYMVTDTEKMEAVIDDAYILITDKKISNIQDVLPLLEQIVQQGKKLIIIAVIVLLLAIAAGVIIVMSVWPKDVEDINTEEYQIQETAVPEIMETATPEPTLEPTPTPIVSMGKKEQIPQDVWASMQGKSYTPNNNVGYDDLMYLTMK